MCQKAGRLALVNAKVSLVCLLLRFFHLLNILAQGNGGCNCVSKGASTVLLALMGKMSCRVTRQKARRLALANANILVYVFSFIFLFVKHFCVKEGGA